MSETKPLDITKIKPREVRLSKTLRAEFYEFVANTSVARMIRILRDFLIAYLRADPDNASFFFESKDFEDLQMLFYLFEIIEEEFMPED
jgi:hypothetical protein